MNIQQQDERIKKLMADVGLPDSRSLYDAFKQFSQELTYGLIGSNWGPKQEYKSPYDIPYIVLPKVTLEEVLNMLRGLINRERMPSSPNKTTIASKPSYPMWEDSRLVLEAHPDFANPAAFAENEGCFGAFMRSGLIHYSMVTDGQVWVYTNLNTDATIVSTDLENWYPWVQDKPLAINLVKLKENAQWALG
jgi:hypothetical protein